MYAIRCWPLVLALFVVDFQLSLSLGKFFNCFCSCFVFNFSHPSLVHPAPIPWIIIGRCGVLSLNVFHFILILSLATNGRHISVAFLIQKFFARKISWKSSFVHDEHFVSWKLIQLAGFFIKNNSKANEISIREHIIRSMLWNRCVPGNLRFKTNLRLLK